MPPDRKVLTSGDRKPSHNNRLRAELNPELRFGRVSSNSYVDSSGRRFHAYVLPVFEADAVLAVRDMPDGWHAEIMPGRPDLATGEARQELQRRLEALGSGGRKFTGERSWGAFSELVREARLHYPATETH